MDNKRKHYFACVNKSLVNHIGEVGLHSNKRRFDTDSKFNLKE